jgi:hypothetical protein
MQIYRVVDFTFGMDITAPPTVSPASLDAIREALVIVNPALTDAEILERIIQLETTSTEDIRYRCQIINPLAGVTDWEDFSSHLGRTMFRQTDFPLYKKAPAQNHCDQELVEVEIRSTQQTRWPRKQQEDAISLRSVSSSRSRMTDIEELPPSLRDTVTDTNYNPYITLFQSKPSGRIPSMRVDSDFTYADGHSGTQKLVVVDDAMLQTEKCTFNSAGVPTILADPGPSTVSAAIEFQNGLVAARRTVALGMKLFSTEAALTANGRIVGGELPISLVTNLLQFQDQEYLHPTGTGAVELLNWTPLSNAMDEWANKIESRLDDYVAYRAADGCTVRYNTLQTDEQARYVYSRSACSLQVTPLQTAYDPQAMIRYETDGAGGIYPKQNQLSEGQTSFSTVRVQLPQPFVPACDGSEQVPVILYSPADPVRLNYDDIQDQDREDGLFFQAVIHTENLTTDVFPMETSDSVFDPNWELYSRICCEDSNFPIVVEGHSFGSFMRKAGRVARTAMKLGARAIEIGEVMLPLLSI